MNNEHCRVRYDEPRPARASRTERVLKRVNLCLLISLFAGLGWAGAVPPEEQAAAHERALPDGLETFLRARQLESEGAFREAAEAYAQAMEQAPEVNEIRVAFGSMLLDIGMPQRTMTVLDGRENLDWYGKKALALALGQLSTKDASLLPKARKALDEALAERSDDPNIQLMLAHVLAAQGSPAEAEEIMANLRESTRGSVRLELFHAQLLAETGRPGEAAEVVARCSQPPEAVDQCRDLRIRGLVASGRIGEAGTELASWLEPDDLDGHLRAAAMLMDGGQSDRALRLVRTVLAKEKDSPGANQMEAMLLVELNRFDEARPKLKALLKKNPGSLEVLLGLAWTEAAAGRGDIEKARVYLGRAWELVSDDAASSVATRVCLNAAQLEVGAGHPTAAREWLDRVADVRSAGPQLPFLLAETYRINQDWAKGAAALARLQPQLGEGLRAPALALEIEFRMKAGDGASLARLKPLLESERVPDVLMALQVMQSLERWEPLEKQSAVALERFPDEPDVAFIRATALERSGRLDEASVVFENILKADPGNANAANYLGYMWADAGENLDRAAELIRMAVEANPGNSAFLDSLGWVEYRLGRLGEAERWLRRAVDLGGDGQGTVVAHLGEVLFELGKDDEAQRFLQHALDIGSDHPERVKELLDRIRDSRR